MASDIPKDAFLLLIGAMKSGTSTLYSYLVQHPQICGAKVKEPFYFMDDPMERLPHDPSISCYEDLWDFDPADHRYALEGSTGYTKYPAQLGLPKRIFDHGLRPKFIYIVRDPCERIISEYNYNQSRHGAQFDLGRCSYLIERSNYGLQLAKFLEYFPQEDFLVLDFEDLKKDPAQMIQRSCEFLGLSNEGIQIEKKKLNPTQLRSNTHKKMKGSSALALMRKLPGPVKQLGKAVLHQVDPVPEKYVMSESERAFVHYVLKDDMQKFADDWGMDVKKWGF